MNNVIKLCQHLFSALLLACIIASPAYADHYTLAGWYVGLGAAAVGVNPPDTMQVLNGTSAPPPSNYDNYIINNNNRGGLRATAGYRWHRDDLRFPQNFSLAVNYNHVFNADVAGSVEQFSLPQFTNYDYHFKYDADVFTLTGKVALLNKNAMLPYVSVGAGVAFNEISDYEESPIGNITPRTNPAFGNHSNTAAVVTLGIGVDIILEDHLGLTFGYEHLYQNNNIESGDGVGSWATSKLDVGTISLDTLFLMLTYQFPDYSTGEFE